jgi:hypothetical protein
MPPSATISHTMPQLKNSHRATACPGHNRKRETYNNAQQPVHVVEVGTATWRSRTHATASRWSWQRQPRSPCLWPWVVL